MSAKEVDFTPRDPIESGIVAAARQKYPERAMAAYETAVEQFESPVYDVAAAVRSLLKSDDVHTIKQGISMAGATLNPEEQSKVMQNNLLWRRRRAGESIDEVGRPSVGAIGAGILGEIVILNTDELLAQSATATTFSFLLGGMAVGGAIGLGRALAIRRRLKRGAALVRSAHAEVITQLAAEHLAVRQPPSESASEPEQ